ncbi:MAG: hypothetical protein JWM53_6351 [bacterium]|nr:hypothetical protein [bacterium]
MDRKRLQRVAVQWGGLALVAQVWVALVFVRRFLLDWEATRPQLVSFAESMNRFSQLKTPALKYPWGAVYFVLFVAGIVALLGWLALSGLREAMAPELESSDDHTDES